MTFSPDHRSQRRSLLLAAVSSPVAMAMAGTSWATAAPTLAPAAAPGEAMLAALEKTSSGRLGVSALNTADGRRIDHRAQERFPFCSTFKVILAAAILERSTRVSGLMQQRVHYAQKDLVTYSPISGKHVASGMTVAQLCAAALQYSDNTSGNLLIKILGGPPAVTAFARSIDDKAFRLDRWETELNTAIPGDPRDTSTPAAMAASLHALVLGDRLPVPQREQLRGWLCGNTTGAKRVRAGAPANWQIGDKTGSGDYGTANDIAVLWPPAREPIVLVVYYTRGEPGMQAREDVIAAATRIVVGAFG